MPTPEEIKKIAREYAESVNPNAPYDTLSDNKKKLRDMCVREVYIPLLEWLFKDYCIVPKEQIKDTYNNFANKLTDKFHLTAQERATANASIASALVNLFGTELFNEEKEVDNA